tara:strand:- start:86 stop:853 length:768 start_codon:yes stop_codon:yes gene_type:complete
MNKKFYDKPLSEIFSVEDFNDTGILSKDKDTNGFTFGWDYKGIGDKPKKLFYALGCSWLHSNFFHKTFINNYPEYLLINQSFGGNGNSLMIDTIKKDIEFLKSSDMELFVLVSFSEVGRNKNDFKLLNPVNFTSTHDYFAEILKKQYGECSKLLENTNSYITTSFINNNFNSNSTILDFCGEQEHSKPDVNVYHYGSGIYEYMKDRSDLFPFEYDKDLEATLLSKKWFAGHQFVDETLHVNSYEPYEKFLKELPI